MKNEKSQTGSRAAPASRDPELNKFKWQLQCQKETIQKLRAQGRIVAEEAPAGDADAGKSNEEEPETDKYMQLVQQAESFFLADAQKAKTM